MVCILNDTFYTQQGDREGERGNICVCCFVHCCCVELRSEKNDEAKHKKDEEREKQGKNCVCYN